MADTESGKYLALFFFSRDLEFLLAAPKAIASQASLTRQILPSLTPAEYVTAWGREL